MFINAWAISRRKNKKLVATVASEERNCLAEVKGSEETACPSYFYNFIPSG